MSQFKHRLTVYVTDKDKDIIRFRSSQVGRSMSDYLSELVMWDRHFGLIEHAREGTLEIKEEVIQHIAQEK